MRKIIVKMASMVLIFVMCITSLVGCGLVTTDTERDMNQVVATIQIDENAPKDTIYKKDMVMAYLNYGYMYEQYYGYSREQTFTLIIDSLVNNRVFVQNAIKAQYKEANGWDIEKYLDEEAKLEANYNTVKAINDLIDSYKTQPEAEKSDTAWETVRTVPTNATNKEKDVNKADYVTAGILTEDTAEYRKAFNKVVELLRVNELLGDEYDGKDLTKTDYYKQTLKNYQETELIEAYEKSIKKSVIDKFTLDANGKITLDKLNKAYLDKLDAQKELSTTDWVAKLSSATASDPLLVGFNGSYGYVYNLLIGADDVLKAEISSIKDDLDKDNITKVEYATARREILEATVVIDQRSSWIASGYDFDYDADSEMLKFTGDYTFAENADNSFPFVGSVEKIKDATDDENAKYKVTGVEELGLAQFVSAMEYYMYGGVQTSIADTNPSVYKKVKYNTEVVEYKNKINELLFAFSTDPGSLNTYKGYVIKPIPEGADQEEYMQEFADGARELIAMDDNKYGYIMVATDYGYHIMFYSEILDANYGFDSLTEYLDDLYGAKDWNAELEAMVKDWDEVEDTDSYLYLIANSLFSTEVTNAVTKYQRDTLNAYRHADDSGVELFKEIYADLLA